ncbi:hypothetical protein A2291_06555 [candidate division WOR-1 bacterium RIFOXYB2_FULL_42_35]|uniref:Carrier domain-containing protein n=1 Tax=candidate division WOR-1 bacterium RIFOXYC2_FULL_41_25 TaxID=1802586 RepID=A0A1F4TQ63_UNCSA|nr:MAG: hypothetical protein A2291_06555 [candidate division WOR-1 bacterium RIFOXYB2_FULL_42_35]OGC24624.1 MAG: hypothetical protein A2247_06335 [candidate division WOR-1 bacterium RIFOXYA2_FULL_41_14]OGC34670.1 MAG: hypothetical protein A2462_04570 [candidate division WOR-1 bacterium RIFOXYC2_FULL_41_25]OGC44086.1 MAG: hypothetical protein A2548_07135 [candidate division WOR-1 bacterium RIFOXYD2_FULL_41_8]
MNKEELFGAIRSLIAKIVKLPEDKIFLNSDLFVDLGVDSILGVEIFAALDQQYNLDVPEAKLKDVHTVSDLVGLVGTLLNQ